MAEHAKSDTHGSTKKSSKKEKEMPDKGCMLDDKMKEMQRKKKTRICRAPSNHENILVSGTSNYGDIYSVSFSEISNLLVM